MTKPIPIPIPPPVVAEKLDSQLWHTITFPHGDYSGSAAFFQSGDYGTVTNVINGCLPVGQNFTIKRIALMPSLDSLPGDVDRLLSNSLFYFSSPFKDYYSGPAQTFYKSSKGLDSVLNNIKKLPKKVQLELLQNIKAPNGMELSQPGFWLSELQCFMAKLQTRNPVLLKKEVKITCLLEGTLVRRLTS